MKFIESPYLPSLAGGMARSSCLFHRLVILAGASTEAAAEAPTKQMTVFVAENTEFSGGTLDTVYILSCRWE